MLALVVGVMSIGCSSSKTDELIASKDAEITRLQGEVDDLRSQVQAEQERAAQLNRELETALSEYKDKEQIWLEQRDASSVITISEAVLFGSGTAELTNDGRKLIDTISGVAGQHADRSIRVEGHTDNVPIGAELKEKYPSNWELAAARASSVIHYMQWNNKLAPDRLSAVGFGEHRPIAENESAEGRMRNRRVVIVIGPKL